MNNLSKKYAAYQYISDAQALKNNLSIQQALASSTTEAHEENSSTKDFFEDASDTHEELDSQDDTFEDFDEFADFDNFEDFDEFTDLTNLDSEDFEDYDSSYEHEYSMQGNTIVIEKNHLAHVLHSTASNPLQEESLENLPVISDQDTENENISDVKVIPTTPWEELEAGTKSWEEFSHSAKDQIVRHYSPKIRFIASRMKAKLPKHIELTELISAGTIGLLEALGKFKPQLAIRFDSYAESRIRGAMIDELRRLDWFPRSLRARVREINQAVWRIESEHGRTPTTEEISELTGLSEKDVNTGLEALQNQLCVSLDVIQDCVAGDGGVNNEEDPYKNAAFLELVDKVSSIIETLTAREKLVLSLYYNDELNMREASEVMDITEGRVSQLHTQAITRLRRIFAEQFHDSL